MLQNFVFEFLTVYFSVRKNGKFFISTLSSPIEVLKIFRPNALKSVFVHTEILGLRNVHGEGCSLTHEEWVFAAKELRYFPPKLTDFLLKHVSGAGARKVPADIMPDLAQFVIWLLCNHPTQGNIRVCNKLIPLCDSTYHPKFLAEARKLLATIEGEATTKYEELRVGVDLHTLVSSITEIAKKALSNLGQRELKQTSVTGIPKWFKHADEPVENTILAQLLLCSNGLEHWEALPSTFTMEENPESAADPQQFVISYLKEVFMLEYILHNPNGKSLHPHTTVFIILNLFLTFFLTHPNI